MSAVASKNLFELLGNDESGDDTPNTAPQIIDKKVTGTKHTGPLETPAAGAPRRGQGGNENAFRDSDLGRDNNLARPTEHGGHAGRGGRGARVRGGRGSDNKPRLVDRIPRHHAPGSEKQGNQAWGAPEGQAGLKDEEAGEQIAEAEKTEAAVEDANEGANKPEEETAEPAEPAEPEPKVLSLDEYKAELAEKQASLGEHNIRQANEGSNTDMWTGLTAYSKHDDEEFVPAAAPVSKQRSRDRKPKEKEKELIALDNTYHEPEFRASRGGEYRGGRGGRGGRGRGNDAPRGNNAHRGSRGGPRGGGGRGSEAPNTQSQADFPALGA